MNDMIKGLVASGLTFDIDSYNVITSINPRECLAIGRHHGDGSGLVIAQREDLRLAGHSFIAEFRDLRTLNQLCTDPLGP